MVRRLFILAGLAGVAGLALLAWSKLQVYPSNPTRQAAPAHAEARAIAVGAETPSFTRPSTKGTWSRGGQTHLLVFYRGHW
jgi:hypothetical protein